MLNPHFSRRHFAQIVIGIESQADGRSELVTRPGVDTVKNDRCALLALREVRLDPDELPPVRDDH
jgi:hypothetical protein